MISPLTEFGSTTNSTATMTSVSLTSNTTHGVGPTTTVTSTIVQSVPTPDWTIPLTIIAVLVIALVVIAIARRKKS